MKASELRIGNYVNESYSGNLVVYGISINYIDAGKPNGINGRYDIDSLKPIPLSEELFVKFGFKKTTKYGDFILQFNADDLFYGNDNKLIREECNEIGCSLSYGGGIFGKCKYVHQLQNLYFALTGEELTIN